MFNSICITSLRLLTFMWKWKMYPLVNILLNVANTSYLKRVPYLNPLVLVTILATIRYSKTNDIKLHLGLYSHYPVKGLPYEFNYLFKNKLYWNVGVIHYFLKQNFILFIFHLLYTFTSPSALTVQCKRYMLIIL